MADKLRVMVLDDEPIVGKRLDLILRKDYEVEVFQEPVIALGRFSVEPFDIVVTDVVMGDVDGIMVLEHVMKWSPRTRVIIMTAFAMMELARKAMERGAFDFIAKPFDPAELRDIVARAAAALEEEE